MEHIAWNIVKFLLKMVAFHIISVNSNNNIYMAHDEERTRGEKPGIMSGLIFFFKYNRAFVFTEESSGSSL